MAQRRGISNVVATIILIAVAIALAVAVAIWVFGIFKGSARATTLNTISEDLYVTSSGTPYLILYVSNPGGTTQNIVSVTLNGVSCAFSTSSSSSPPPSSPSSVATTAPGVTETNNEVVIAGGTIAYLVYTCTGGSFTPGVQYNGVIYLSTGTNIPFTVTAQVPSS